MAFASQTVNYASRCHSPALRSSVVPRAVAAPTRPVKSAVPELLDGRLAEQSTMNFQEYTQATQMLNRLKGQASDLELLLDQLNALEASLDDTLLAPPPVDEPAARQAKRAAKRAERRAKATTAVVMDAPVTDVAPSSSFTQPKADSLTSTSGRSITQNASSIPAARAAASAGANSDVQQLEELFKLTVGEPELPRVRMPTLLPQAAAAPSVLRPRKAPKKSASATTPATSPPPAKEPPAAVPAAAPAPSAPQAPPTFDSLSMLDQLLGPLPSSSNTNASSSDRGRSSEAAGLPHRDDGSEGQDAFAGPTDEELRALEREVAALAAVPLDEDEDEQVDVPGVRELEASALVSRAPEQLSVSATGPSLLSLAPAAAVGSGAARSRQARRSARLGSGMRGGGSGSGAGALRAQRSSGRDGTDQFLARSTSVVLLNAENEREVTAMCQDYLFLEKVKRQCEKTLHRRPSAEEMAAAVGMEVRDFNTRYDAGLKAKELLLRSNYRLVMTICKSYIGKGLHIQDLVSEGVKGLLRSVEMYDASKGYRFGTYAHWWIRQAISRSMAETGRAVRLPVNMIEQLSKLRNVMAQLANQLNREPTQKELSDAVGLPVSRIELLLEAARRASSLDAPVGSDGGATVKDNLEDSRGAADEEFGTDRLKTDIESMLDGLSEREGRVLRLRFGLDDGKEWTLEEVGALLGVTRERIRQLEAKALRKLQVKTIDTSGKLKEYSENFGLLENKDIASRNSLGTRKT